MVEEDTVEFWELRIREDTEAMIKAIKDGDRSAQKDLSGDCAELPERQFLHESY
jgi:hypothetical protein